MLPICRGAPLSYGGIHACSKRVHVPIRSTDEWAECRHGSEVPVVCSALVFIGGASLGADQCLGPPGALSHVRHVQTMTVDLLVQVPTALLSYTEALRLGGGIKSESQQFATIVTSACNCHVLPPILGRCGRLLAAGQQEFGGMTP